MFLLHNFVLYFLKKRSKLRQFSGNVGTKGYLNLKCLDYQITNALKGEHSSSIKGV